MFDMDGHKKKEKGAKRKKIRSAFGQLKHGLLSLGTKVGSEHTGIGALDSALDSVFGAVSSKVRDLGDSSSGSEPASPQRPQKPPERGEKKR